MKKYFIYGLVISLVVAGLLGIAVLLNGIFDDLQIRILFTTLAFTIYSIIGLCCNSIIEGKYSVFGKLGLGTTFVGLLSAVVTTWEAPESEAFLKLSFSLLVIGFCFAHCSLMLLVKTYNSTISAVRVISMSASIFATQITVTMITSLYVSEGTFKVLGVVAIVGVISTIIAPILAFTANKQRQLDT